MRRRRALAMGMVVSRVAWLCGRVVGPVSGMRMAWAWRGRGRGVAWHVHLPTEKRTRTRKLRAEPPVQCGLKG